MSAWWRPVGVAVLAGALLLGCTGEHGRTSRASSVDFGDAGPGGAAPTTTLSAVAGSGSRHDG